MHVMFNNNVVFASLMQPGHLYTAKPKMQEGMMQTYPKAITGG